MKIVRMGKEYDYDYKFLYVKGSTHKKIKGLAQSHNLSIGAMIDKMLEDGTYNR